MSEWAEHENIDKFFRPHADAELFELVSLR